MLQLYQCMSRTFSRNFKDSTRIVVCSFNGIMNYHTAGIIVIGDEILKGQVKDTNSHYMCNLLYQWGIKVNKISVISDNVDEIANEIRTFTNKYTYVITTGGIGPTHDDVTYEALSKAFNDRLHYHPVLTDIIKNQFKVQNPSSSAYKLAYIPEKASLKFGVNEQTKQKLAYPCIILKNVHVFPGSPEYFERSFGSLYKELFASDKNFFIEEVFIDAKEESFADALSIVSKEFPCMSFGSYPQSVNSYYKVRVTIESDNLDDVKKAKERFFNLIPPSILVNYDRTPWDKAVLKYEHFIQNCKDRSLYEDSIQILKDLYTNPKSVVIGFDGSIESTVLLHLAHIVINKHSSKNINLQAVYFKREKSFLDVEKFIKHTVERYNINMFTLNGTPQQMLKELVLLNPELKILLIGTKEDKPENGVFHDLAHRNSLESVEIRCPLLKWTYKNVWTFARSLSLLYCSLYDKGYTWIGDQDNTRPNPNLLFNKDSLSNIYYPAHTLQDLKLERAGRISERMPFTDS